MGKYLRGGGTVGMGVVGEQWVWMWWRNSGYVLKGLGEQWVWVHVLQGWGNS